MKNKFAFLSSVSGFIFGVAFATSALATPAGVATFSEQGMSYSGTYSNVDNQISVEIDGLRYKGHFASHANDAGATADVLQPKSWGRAFLFASSANTLQCQIQAPFPAVLGQCQSSEGRIFQLKTPTSKNIAAN